MLGRIAVILTLAGSGVAAAAERAPEQLQLQGKWVADYDEDACHLIGQFGPDKDKIVARFTRHQPGDNFNLVVASNRLRGDEPRTVASVDFGVTGKPIKSKVARGFIGGLPAIFFRAIRIDGWERRADVEVAPPITPEMLKGVSGVTVAVAGPRPFRLVFGSFDKPMAVMRTCLTDLIQSWGYDPAVDATLSRRAKPAESPADWFNSNDFPAAAVRDGLNGTVQYRVDVDPEGKILGCHVVARTKPDEFGDLTCRLVLRRGKFKPALDAAGKPVRGYWISTANWNVES